MKDIIKIIALLPLLIFEHSLAGDEFNYREITQEDIKSVKLDWQSRDLSPKNVNIVIQEEDTGFLLVQHEVLGAKHYGAIITPQGSTFENTPVMVTLDGLNQDDPSMKLDSYPNSGVAKFQPYSNFIKIRPSFRGRTAIYKGLRYPSEGDFCDAYDGATDDAIALVNVAQSLFPDANFNSILADGYSRGGLVALLMGVRDPRVSTIRSFAAPTHFYNQTAKEDYGSQYKCQFLEGRSESQARARMLASSPVFFKPQESLEIVDLHHGEIDEVVPAWHAIKMAEHLSAFNTELTLSIYPLGKHDIFTDPTATIEKIEKGFFQFLEILQKQ